MGGASSYRVIFIFTVFFAAVWTASKISKSIGISSIVLEITTGLVLSPKILGFLPDEYSECYHAKQIDCKTFKDREKIAFKGTKYCDLAAYIDKGKYVASGTAWTDGFFGDATSVTLKGKTYDLTEPVRRLLDNSNATLDRRLASSDAKGKTEYKTYLDCLEKCCDMELAIKCGTTPDVFTVIGHTGVAMMIFESGMHFDFEQAKKVGGWACAVAVLGTFLPLASGMGLIMAYGYDFMEGFAAGTALAPTSVGIALRLLQEAKALQTNFGQAIITAAFVDDILSLILFNVLFSLQGEITAFTFLPLAAGLVFMVFAAGAGASLWPQLLTWIFSKVKETKPNAKLTRHNEILFLIMVAVLLIYAEITYHCGTHLWGCFIAGMSFAMWHEAHHVWVRQTKRITSWMIRIFFSATVAFAIPIDELLSLEALWKGSLMGIGPCILTKVCCGFFMGDARFVIGWAMVGRAEFAYLIAQMAAASNMMSGPVFSIVIWALLWATVFAPFIFRFVLNRYVAKKACQEKETEKAPQHGLTVTTGEPMGKHLNYDGKQNSDVENGCMANGLRKLGASSWDPPAAEEDCSSQSKVVADYIVQCLVDCGVTHVFGGHGAAVVPLIDAICAHPKLTWVYMRCELNASLAAAAYAKLRQGLGVCVGTSGPGAAHLTTGLLDAELDQCPVLCLTGMKNSEKIGLGDFQDIGQTEIFKSAGLSFSQTVIHKNSLVPQIRMAITSALTHYSCAHIAIPFDIQQAHVNVPSGAETGWKGYMNRLIVSAAIADVRACAASLVNVRTNGRRCLIMVGCRAFNASQEIKRLADVLGIPVLTSLHAKGIVSERNARNVGIVGIFGNSGMEASAELVRTADYVIAIGAQIHDQLVMSSQGIQQRKLICVDVGAPVLDQRCQAEHVLLGDIPVCVRDLCDAIDERSGGTKVCGVPFSMDDGQKKARISALGGISWGAQGMGQTGFQVSNVHNRPLTYEAPSNEITDGYCHPGRVLQQLGPKLNEDAVVCVDAGDVKLWTSMCLTLDKRRQRTLASMRLGTMGYSVCAGIAAGALRPESQIVCIAGDGGVQMALTELATVKQLGLKKIMLIVFVNGKLGRVESDVLGPAGSLPPAGCDIVAPDFCKVAAAYGGIGIRLSSSNVASIDAALNKALQHDGLCILEVLQDPAVKPFLAKYLSEQTPGMQKDLQVEEIGNLNVPDEKS